MLAEDNQKKNNRGQNDQGQDVGLDHGGQGQQSAARMWLAPAGASAGHTRAAAARKKGSP